MVARVAPTAGNYLSFDMSFLVDMGGRTDVNTSMGAVGRASLTAMFRGSQAYLQYYSDGNSSTIPSRQQPAAISWNGPALLRMTYDPETNKATVWIDAQKVGDFDVPAKFAAGQRILLTAYSPVKIESVKLLRGVVMPTVAGSSGAGSPADQTAIEFANKDHVTAKLVTLADGQMTLTTDQGDVRCPASTISRIVFGKTGQVEPVRRPDDATIIGGFGRLTLQFMRLTADELVGQSTNLGEIHLRRAAIREVKFGTARAN
jgi:hypothetical protein